MRYAKLIAKEIVPLSLEKRAKVLNFVAALNAQESPSALPELSAEQERKRDELAAFFSSFNADLTGYRFDREDASGRR